MATSAVPATRLREGDLILLPGQEDEIFKVKKIGVSAPGKHGHSKVNLDYTNIFTGSGGNTILSGHTDVEKPVIEKERAQVLSIVPGKPKTHTDPGKQAIIQLMNLQTYETYELPLPPEIPEKDVQNGMEIEVRFFGTKKWIERVIREK
ncbi:TPA: hypothetical protein H1005_02495 [archaeon]|uniref:Translation initiation factor 5A-like N-terminal domain-containing protein n=1 Tax=Candidatus Naiadarchaeum limnaeum TaxID=2756139 RepID=A0A832X5S9_9ARCH|nr:hypothetical protein [Candidatus Naiadarchaeales archaeon SRR2090153.bin1042]HIK00110.1 hypothetical protein [Candidatus Naiadarchaeum limnaeum]